MRGARSQHLSVLLLDPGLLPEKVARSTEPRSVLSVDSNCSVECSRVKWRRAKNWKNIIDQSISKRTESLFVVIGW